MTNKIKLILITICMLSLLACSNNRYCKILDDFYLLDNCQKINFFSDYYIRYYYYYDKQDSNFIKSIECCNYFTIPYVLKGTSELAFYDMIVEFELLTGTTAPVDFCWLPPDKPHIKDSTDFKKYINELKIKLNCK